MLEVKVLDINGAETGRTVKLPESLFGIEPNDHAIYLAVKQYRANQRQGTHSTKERSQLSGSTRKLFRQKGTGGARRGDINSPLLRGGATVFGPHPRNYRQKLNKKVKNLARASALSYKAKNNEIIVIEDIKMDAPKTKTVASMLKALNADKGSALLVLKSPGKNVSLSVRNVPRLNLLNVANLNTYQVLESKHMIFTESALSEIENVLNA